MPGRWPGMVDFSRRRAAMVERQLRARGIVDPAVLAAFAAVSREAFVAEGYEEAAYDDRPLPIACGQTISQPYVVAVALQAAGLGPEDHVLEIGAGSGYAAALIGRIARDVVAVERHPELASGAAIRLRDLGVANVQVMYGDGTLGWPDEAPFDVILASATGSHVPAPWLEQLKTGGRLIMPLADRLGSQTLVKLTKRADEGVDREELGAVRFVPLIGAEGVAS